MKKYLLIPVFILLCVSLSAQKLSVSDFNHHPEIIVTKPPHDSNGNICSLLEINTPGINEEQRMKFRFEADAATQIVETSYPDGIIRVWLSPDAFSLVIIHRDYGRKVYEFPVIMKPKNVYSMNVSYSDTEDEKSVGWLLIDTQPESGADVYLNDEHKGVTPLSLKVDYGRYFIRVEKPFYHKSNDVIDVNKTEGNEKTLIMKPKHGFIKVTTTPTNAEVIIDDMIVLKSPCTTEKLASGEHNVNLRYDRYKPYNQKVNVNDGETCELNVNLVASFAEITIVNSIGGDIYVDGIKKGTDRVTLELGEGYHDIEAKATNHKTDKQNVKIDAGKLQTFTLSPKPICGSLDVISVPPKAAITIDGKDYGVTPKTIDGLLIGKHTVTFALAGYASETRTVTITENVTETLNVKLSTGKYITINSDPSGANVYIDGTYLGTTPLTKQFPFGSHNLKVSLDGEEKSEAINVSEGGKSSWSFDVSKKPKVSIGSLYTFNDGSKGIVFYLDSNGHGLVVSLDERDLKWSKSKSDILNIPNDTIFNKNLNMGLGATYTKYIVNQLGKGKAPAAEWCRKKGSEWYLPSAGELWQLIAVANEKEGESGRISKSLKNNRGTELDGWYWSSSEYSHGFVWYMYINGYVYYYNKNYYNYYYKVRAVRAF